MPGLGETHQRRTKHVVLWSALSALVVGAVTAGFVVATSSGPTVPGTGIAPADFVVSSTQNTLAKNTAEVVFTLGLGRRAIDTAQWLGTG